VNASGADSKGACTTGTYKVTLTKDGTSDDTQCPAESTTSIPNVTRNKLICLAKQKLRPGAGPSRRAATPSRRSSGSGFGCLRS